jgi:hypothetical protein
MPRKLMQACLLVLIAISLEQEPVKGQDEWYGRKSAESEVISDHGPSIKEEQQRRRALYSAQSSVGASAAGMPLQAWQIQARAGDGSYRLDPFAFVEDVREKAEQFVSVHAAATRRGPRMNAREDLGDVDYHYLRHDSRSGPD